jgi:hypothetical protein
MGKALIALAFAGLLAVSLAALAPGHAGVGMPATIGSAIDAQPLYTPVLVFKDCQRVALCPGCAPVFRCRSCEYKRTCEGGRCGWGDVCVWGPYVKVLPRGARIIQ